MSSRLKVVSEEKHSHPKPNSDADRNPNPKANDSAKGKIIKDLGNGSQVIYIPRFLGYEESWKFFDYLDKQIPWTRPTIRVFGRSCLQPRETCYVASTGLPELVYSGYQPHAYSWDDFPPLKEILERVYEVLPGSRFNSLLLNRYKGGNDYVGWHADDEKLYGPTPEIASVTFGCEREFVLKKKPSKLFQGEMSNGEPATKRLKKSNSTDQVPFTLKHGSLLVMRGYTQRDWIHSVPKRAKFLWISYWKVAEAFAINRRRNVDLSGMNSCQSCCMISSMPVQKLGWKHSDRFVW